MPTNLSITDQIALSQHRVFLLKELNRSRNTVTRSAVYEQLTHFSELLGLSVPPLNTIGLPEPEQSADEALAPLWAALDLLDGKDEPYNHSATPDSILALNFKDLQIRLDKHRCGLVIDSALRRLLAKSESPKVIETNRNVASVLSRKTVRCMIFEPRD